MLNEEGLKAAVRAVIQEIQLRDFGHRKANGDFVTTGPKIDLLEAQARKAAEAAITAYLSTIEKPVDKWAIDNSTPSPILTYENCSVIQDEQAYYVLDLVRNAASTPPASATKGE